MAAGIAAGVAAASAAQTPAPEQGKEELKLQLPKPMFVGTPRNINSPNLEKVTGKSRGPFFVPAGTKLISLNKPVTSSDTQPVIGDATYVTDGEKSGEDGYFVELGPGKQYVQIDLKAPHQLNAILVWHYHAQARVYRDVVVLVSDDKDFVSGVTTVFNNDHDNSSGLGLGKDKEYIETAEGKLIDPRGVRGRYLRLWSSGNTSNDMNHYVEVEIYGTPVK
ncbi:MAG: hypothetical protein A2W03_06485 [Candidatus Aminicenantes bacterium RBG_16_63_16]|nr:MAG: hypothetical protein A2W03_06485 [Candidatus Aminicenantes bacterium RBG_16_63_16]